MVLGLTSIAGMTGKSPAKGFLAAFIGLFVAGIGIDLIFGTTKFVFGNVNLYSGIDFVPVAMGLFGIAEIVCNYSDNNLKVDKGSLKVKNLLPSRHEWKLSLPHIGRGTILGFIVGMLPGAGATIASFLSYDMAKRHLKAGRGVRHRCDRGCGGPGVCQQRCSMGAMVPMLTLGVPGSGATAS